MDPEGRLRAGRKWQKRGPLHAPNELQDDRDDRQDNQDMNETSEKMKA